MKLPINYEELDWAERKKVREEYIKIQDGKCRQCGALLCEEADESRPVQELFSHLFPSGFFDHPIHLHHSHETGMTIGAVHAVCNAALWVYEGE
jgi:hypothetical protein